MNNKRRCALGCAPAAARQTLYPVLDPVLANVESVETTRLVGVGIEAMEETID